jgi:hypothetical protein
MTSEKQESFLAQLADAYEVVQKQRVSWGNRLASSGQPVTAEGESPSRAAVYSDIFEKLEKQIVDDVETQLEQCSIWPWLQAQRGIAARLAARIVQEIDISKARHISSLWKFAGYDVQDGKAPKRTKGQKLTYCSRLRSSLHIAGESMLRCKSPYRVYYDESKTRYQKREGWTKLHIHLAARRYMLKRFLSDMWVEWRTRENLPVDPPYSHTEWGARTEREASEKNVPGSSHANTAEI